MICEQFSFVSKDIYDIIVSFCPEIYVRDCLNVIKRMRMEINDLDNEIKKKRRKIDSYKSSMKEWCPHSELHQEIWFDGHKNNRTYSCILCKCDIDWNERLKITDYKIVSYSRC
ncbi:uncharacterized protein METZ01_LOCUS84061 [marine metagenome]|jgi:hypothetical protein|uniref:Uncharacterized protein n=1 Tax=marine metagenome TaxID=408172 RepID=A0A381UV43_9ZZZZ|tara:strand:- start:135 stop:476 length:342 start_codon:yes stop_codon:yes gene_type:complete